MVQSLRGFYVGVVWFGGDQADYLVTTQNKIQWFQSRPNWIASVHFSRSVTIATAFIATVPSLSFFLLSPLSSACYAHKLIHGNILMKVKERPQAFHAHSTMMWASDYCQTVSALRTLNKKVKGCVHGSQPNVQQTRFARRKSTSTAY